MSQTTMICRRSYSVRVNIGVIASEKTDKISWLPIWRVCPNIWKATLWSHALQYVHEKCCMSVCTRVCITLEHRVLKVKRKQTHYAGNSINSIFISLTCKVDQSQRGAQIFFCFPWWTHCIKYILDMGTCNFLKCFYLSSL